MRTRLAVPALIAALFVAPARAQDPEKIIDQYIKAQGGAKNLAKAQTISIEGTFTNAADGKTGTYTFDTKLPNRYYSELVIGDQNSSRRTTANPRGTARRTATSPRSSELTARSSKPPGSTTIRTSSTRRKINSASRSSVTRR